MPSVSLHAYPKGISGHGGLIGSREGCKIADNAGRFVSFKGYNRFSLSQMIVGRTVNGHFVYDSPKTTAEQLDTQQVLLS